MQCDRPQPASDSLPKAAHALEDILPNDANCVILEDDGKKQMALIGVLVTTSAHRWLLFLGKVTRFCLTVVDQNIDHNGILSRDI